MADLINSTNVEQDQCRPTVSLVTYLGFGEVINLSTQVLNFRLHLVLLLLNPSHNEALTVLSYNNFLCSLVLWQVSGNEHTSVTVGVTVTVM